MCGLRTCVHVLYAAILIPKPCSLGMRSHAQRGEDETLFSIRGHVRYDVLRNIFPRQEVVNKGAGNTLWPRSQLVWEGCVVLKMPILMLGTVMIARLQSEFLG